MGHDHSHHHHHHHHAEGNIRFAFFLNLLFTIIEIVGGIYTGSLAILSDALHDFGDSLSLGLAWYFQKLSKKGRDDRYSYGYRRFSLLGAIINATVLVVGSVFILNEAIPALFNPGDADAQGMIVIALFGIVVNGAAVLRLKKGDSINEKVVMLHLMEDVLGWVAVLIGSIIMYFWDVPIIDPLLSILIALYVLYNVVINIRNSFRIILQATPGNVDIDVINKKVLEMPKVVEMHDCHAWSMDGSYNVLTMHLVLEENLSLTEQCVLKKEIKDLLKGENINHMTVEFEMKGEDCELDDC
ncbi:MAG: cation diffusion facilitator family transporter [bacterium]|nr:cation diffusion facilitator family transporter [bacterium]